MADASVEHPELLPPPARRYSILPAMAVLGIAILTLASFAIVDLWVSPSTTPTTLPDIVVGDLRPAATTTAFAHWVDQGTPPSNIASALIVPTGTATIATIPTGGDGVDFDREVRLSVPAGRAVLLGFYRSNLEAIGWHLFSTGAAPQGGGDELIFEKGGDNGDYWNCGVIAQATANGQTTYDFRLFDIGDNE